MAHPRSRSTIAKQARIQQMAQLGPADFAHGHFTPKDTANLQQQLIGTAVLPSSPGYATDRLLSNPAFQSYPAIIVYCQVFDDVWHSLAFAHRHRLHALCRSGGHSTAGFSVETGAMVIDTSRLSYTVVDPGNRTAIVGAGTCLGALNGALDGYRLHTPGGACADVGIAGHMMGGGYGWTSREYGMNCDNVLEVLVMLADGRTVRANAERNPDLYWAVCGGTGNNFGVLLEIKYRLFDCWKLWGFGLSWPMAHAPAALVALQRDYMLDAAPREFGYQTAWITHQGQKRLVVRGTFHGTPEAGRKLIAPLLKLPGATSEIDTVETYNELNEGIITKPYAYPDIPPDVKEDKISGYLTGVPDAAQWREIISVFEKDKRGWAFGNLEIYGGAINALPRKSNAFVHRDVYLDWVQDVFWETEAERPGAERFLQEMIDAWTPYLNGHANQDYPRSSQNAGFRWLFWGDAFNTLLWIKQKYDPDNFFHYSQSISPYPPGQEPRDTSTPLFSDRGIVEEPYSRRFSAGP